MTVAVLGAGHGGTAMAADLTLSGHAVRLACVPEHARGLVVPKALGGIHLEGVTSGGGPVGFAPISMITDDVGTAIRDAEVILVVVPAFGQEVYYRLLVEHCRPDQLIMTNPGKFGALVLARLLKEAGRSTQELLVVDAEGLLYASKLQSAERVKIKAVKHRLPISAIPASRTAEAVERMQALFPQIVAGQNVVVMGINDGGIPLHPTTTLLNMSRIELMGPYRNDHYDVTPGVGRVLDAVDGERVAVAQALGFDGLSLADVLKEVYGVEGAGSYEVIRNVTAYNTQMAPDSLTHRYVTEDVPYGLVPIASLGRGLGVPTPTLDALITIAETATGMEFTRSGRNLEQMGLAGLSRAQILALVG